MNARVFMVLVFSAVFMGIWNSDQKAMDSAIARHKRLNKSIAVFPIRPVETVGRENLSPSGFAGPEQKPVRIAMGANSRIGQSAYVMERQEEVSRHESGAELSVESAETLMPETAAIKTPVSELTVSQTVVTEILSEIEQDPVPAPEDFFVDVKPDASVRQVFDAEETVNTESRVIVAENTTEESVVDYSAEVEVENSQSAPESAETELLEPADPVIEDSAVPSDVVAINEAAASTEESVVGESEDEKSLEETLLKSGEYDMLDVHSENVTPGTVEPAWGGGATCIPMPRNLASGTWQVIHPSGEFFRITVDRGTHSTADRRHDNTATLETSFCITTSHDGERWCFVRSFVDSQDPVRRVTTEFFSPGQQ